MADLNSLHAQHGIPIPEIQSTLSAQCDALLTMLQKLEVEATTDRHPVANFEQRFNALNKALIKSLPHLKGHIRSIQSEIDELEQNQIYVD